MDKHVISFKWDNNKSDKSLILAFSKKQADNRKKWLADYDRNRILDITEKNLTISDFIHKELIHFSNDDNNRSIPHVLDGLKPSQNPCKTYIAYKTLYETYVNKHCKQALTFFIQSESAN